MKDHSTLNYFEIAKELNIPNEYLKPIKQIENLIWFQTISGSSYTAKLNKNGSLKKNSIRKD